jgi:hypothetical protein
VKYGDEEGGDRAVEHVVESFDADGGDDDEVIYQGRCCGASV